MPEEESNRRIAKNSVYMSIRMIIVLIISLYTTRVVLNVLGVDDYGVYNVVAGFVSMFAFLNNALSSSTQRFYNFELGRNGVEGARVVYCASLVIHLLLAIVVVIISEAIGIWYINHKMVLPDGRLRAAETVFHFSVLSLFISIITTPFTAAVIAHEKMDFYAIVGVLEACIKLAVALALPFILGDKLIWYGALFVLIAVQSFLLSFIFCKLNFVEMKRGGKVPRSLYNDMLSFSGWSVLGSLAYVLREQGVDLLLNSFFGTIVNAARGVANQVNGALQGFINSLSISTRPQVIQSYAQGNLSRTWSLTFTISKVTCLFFFMMSLPICLEVDCILRLWLGQVIPSHTELFIILMLFSNTFGVLVSPVSTVMHATGKMRYYQTLSSASNLLTLPLAYVFLLMNDVPEYAYIALFITMSTNLLAGLISTHKYAGLKYQDYFRFVLLPCLTVIIISIPIAFIPHLFLHSGFLRLIVEIFLSVIIVSGISYLFALNETEKQLVMDFVFRFKTK